MFTLNYKDETRGFHIEFSNGWNVSVQWGRGTYSENYNSTTGGPSATAEVWSWNEETKERYPESPEAYQTPEEVARFISIVSQKDFAP